MHAQLCQILWDPMECSPPDSYVHGIFQERILEWAVISSSGVSSQPRDQTHVFCISYIGRYRLYHWATWETHSVQLSFSAVSNFLPPHGLQPARLACPSPTPRVYSHSCWLSQWCHPTISFSVVPFASRLQSFPASGYFQTSQFFTLGGNPLGNANIP